jgi:transposase
MQKTYDFFIGIDVSKDKLDYCITSKETLQNQFGIVANNAKGINGFIKSLLKTMVGGASAANNSKVVLCLENTGVYSMPLCYWLQANKLDYAVVAALEIKRSKGIARGKTDKADARDIAAYALSHVHELKLSELPQDDFIELRLLLAEREKTVKAISLFQTTSENKNYLPKEVLKTTLHHNQAMMAFLNKQLKQIEKSIDSLVKRNDVFKRQDELLQSIPGIGRQTSIMFIAYTQAFTLFKTYRQFACFAGVAPFEYSSGSSVRGKTKVSHLANKKIKTALNMAALTAKKYDPQLKLYYDKKVAEGKNKMLVLNAVRCKLISRAFAVINRNSPFVNTLKAVA